MIGQPVDLIQVLGARARPHEGGLDQAVSASRAIHDRFHMSTGFCKIWPEKNLLKKYVFCTSTTRASGGLTANSLRLFLSLCLISAVCTDKHAHSNTMPVEYCTAILGRYSSVILSLWG